MQWSDIEAAALARNERFLTEVIEGMSVCPYARAARLAGATRRHVLPDAVSSSRPLVATDRLREIFSEMAHTPSIEVTQIIFPRAAVGAKRWVRAAKEVTERLAADLDHAPIAVAAFHPALDFRDDSPAAMVPLFRRSPDPLIQWVSLDALQRVRSGRPDGDIALPDDADEAAHVLASSARAPLAEQIAQANYDRVRDIGVSRFESLLRSIGES